MIEEFAVVCSVLLSEFLDLNHTSKPINSKVPCNIRSSLGTLAARIGELRNRDTSVMLGVGILGAGFFGAVHARAIGSTRGARLVAVCAEEADLAQAFAAEYGGKAYSDWRQFLCDGAVDAVLIATPHHLHCEMAVAAAEAGKHLLVEKPMARTATECSAIISAADRLSASSS